MQQSTDAGRQRFEVSLYNREVRTLVRGNQGPSLFDAHWADVQVLDVVARDESEARRLIAERFPPEDGFVVTAVMTMALKKQVA
jgi:hypothetical protein